MREVAAGAVVVTNSDWHEAQLAEQRLPLRRDLDAVAPDHPVVVVRGGHEYVLNSAGLARWGITADTPVPAGGEISRYDDGSLNGELIDAAKNLVSLDPPPPRDFETRIADQLAEHARLHAAGLTSIRHPGGAPAQYELLAELKRRGDLRIRVNFLFRVRGARTAEQLGALVHAWPAGQDEGDEWLRVGGVKLGVDGGFEGGWMREPYAEPFGRGETFHGLQTMPAERFTMAVSELNRRGWRVATHAVGDAAIDQVLTGYEAADAEGSIGDRRWTIEHGFIVAADQVARIRELGLVLSAQHHLHVAGPSLERHWGRVRAERVTPVRTYLDQGIAVSLGSDSPVVPFSPLSCTSAFGSAVLAGPCLRRSARCPATSTDAVSLTTGASSDPLAVSSSMLKVRPPKQRIVMAVASAAGGLHTATREPSARRASMIGSVAGSSPSGRAIWIAARATASLSVGP